MSAPPLGFARQHGCDVRCEWGAHAVATLGECRTLVVVDVLTSTSCISIAVSRGATVLPYRWRDGSAEAFAKARGALLAGPRGSQYSLSPGSVMALPRGARLVLPSPNGATISFDAAGHARVIAGCLRNRAAVAAHLARAERPIGIVAAGERWPDDALRPALEDLVGAGAIVAALEGTRSPEAAAAAAVFAEFATRLPATLGGCASGRELIERGYPQDIELASMLDVDAAVPELIDGAFTVAREAGVAAR